MSAKEMAKEIGMVIIGDRCEHGDGDGDGREMGMVYYHEGPIEHHHIVAYFPV